MWPFRRYPRLKALVVGGVHLDTIIDVDNLNVSTDPKHPNYTYYSAGKTIHSIGGTGFNIAENLARVAFEAKKEVGLYTVLAKDSAITRIIRERLIGTRIYRNYVHEAEYGPGDATSGTTAGGFVGVRDTAMNHAKTIRVAATDTPVNQTSWASNAAERSKLEGAIKNAELVAVESYIEISSLTAILNFALRYKRPLFVSVTSETSGLEFLSRSSLTDPAYAISCRISDLQAFAANGGLLSKVARAVTDLSDAFGKIEEHALSERPETYLSEVAENLCTAMNTKHVVCTDMQNLAYAFLSAEKSVGGSGVIKRFDENVVVRAKAEGNLTGIRDGLFSAFIHLAYRPGYDADSRMRPILDFTDTETRRRAIELASRYTAPIAQSKAATPGAVVSFAEMPVPWYFTVWRYLVLINEAAPLLIWGAPVVFFLAAWFFAWIGIAFDLPSPLEWRLPDFSKWKKT